MMIHVIKVMVSAMIILLVMMQIREMMYVFVLHDCNQLYIVYLLIKTEIFIQGVHGFIEDFRLLVTRITKYLHMCIAYQANLNSTFVFRCNTTSPVDPLLTTCRTG